MINIDVIHDIFNENIKVLKELFVDIEDLESEYDKRMLNIYSEYLETRDETQYIQEINSSALIENMNKHSSLYDKVKFINLPNRFFRPTEIDLSECKCGGALRLSETDQVFMCADCGFTKAFTGILGNKIIKPDGVSVVLKNNYKHEGYFKLVYKNIFALEVFEFTDQKEEVERCLEIYIIRNNIDRKSVKCSWFRMALSNLRLSKWFPHINLLKLELTGYHPPRLSEEYKRSLNRYYSLYIHIYDKIFKSGTKRVSYMRCEYTIFKILSQILPKCSEKTEILNHIPLPNRDTVKKLDIKWKYICDESKGLFIYYPTSNTGY
jgi:hypothetical protein